MQNRKRARQAPRPPTTPAARSAASTTTTAAPRSPRWIAPSREERERRRQALQFIGGTHREQLERHKATCSGCELCAPPRAITAAPGDDVRVSRFRAPAQPTTEQHAAALALLGVGAEVPRGEAEPQDERDAAELQAARAEAQRRIDVRGRQAARSAAHEKLMKEEWAAIETAIATRDIRERNIGDGKGSDKLDGLDLAWLECNPPPGIDEQRQVDDQADERALPPPPAGPPTLSELRTPATAWRAVATSR